VLPDSSPWWFLGGTRRWWLGRGLRLSVLFRVLPSRRVLPWVLPRRRVLPRVPVLIRLWPRRCVLDDDNLNWCCRGRGLNDDNRAKLNKNRPLLLYVNHDVLIDHNRRRLHDSDIGLGEARPRLALQRRRLLILLRSGKRVAT
jgi:hypothetical protein